MLYFLNNFYYTRMFRLRAEKKMAKERRREEARLKEMGSKEQVQTIFSEILYTTHGAQITPHPYFYFFMLILG